MKKISDARQHLDEVLDALIAEVSGTPSENLKALLKETEAGDDLESLRAALHSMALEQAASYRRSGRAAPKALARFADAMNVGPQLPSDPIAAARKARRFLQQLSETLTAPFENVRLVEAYRKDDRSFTQRDHKLLDAAAARLKEKLGEHEKK